MYNTMGFLDSPKTRNSTAETEVALLNRQSYIPIYRGQCVHEHSQYVSDGTVAVCMYVCMYVLMLVSLQ